MDQVAAMNAAKTADQLPVPNKKRFFFGPEPAGVKKEFVYIRMNSSTGSSGAMKAAKTADQQSRAEQKQ
uniref:Uncharacterized protein n=1 Tax=Acrobeloides nanus TaxID=290746 RepID=A0A914EFB0_9BILA